MSTESKLKIKDKIIAAFIIVFIILLAYVWFSPAGLKVIPNVELTTITGEKLNLESLRGRPVLITFWATSCTGCVKEMPHLIKLHNTFASQGLKIIGISMPYDRPDHVMKMAQQKKLPYTIAMDINKEATKAFGGVSLTPTTFLISPMGTIVWQKIGEFNTQALTSQIKVLLNEMQKTKTNAASQTIQPTNAVRKLK